MRKYTYIDTGIEWLGNIPSHWAVTKIKNEFRVFPSNVDKKSNEGEMDVRLCNYVDVYYNEFIDLNIDYMEATATEHEINKFQLLVGDVLVTKDSEDPFDIGVPALVTETEAKIICGYHLSIIRSTNQKIIGEFLFWLLMDKAIVSQLYREATGVTRWAVASKHIKNCIITFPPISEQITICAFLRKSWVNIEKIIKLKFGESKIKKDDNSTNQLKLITEYRNSLIHECVTGKKQIAEAMSEKVKMKANA